MSTNTSATLSNEHLTGQATHGEAVSFRARLFATNASWAPVLLRGALAVVMFPHGAQKALGWFGGYGFAGTMGFLTEKVGLPTPLAALVIAIEFLGPLFLLAGFATRFAAAGFIAIMLGAIFTTHLPNGFFMNWFGAQAGEGYEYHLLVIGMALALLVGGAGRASIDRKLGRS
ncbi:MAG: DoxX family protein [Planctomycetes bacterium]|nr:DoxX family protein [Planctomycetota bacterium]